MTGIGSGTAPGRAGPTRSRRRTTCGPRSTRSASGCSAAESLRDALRDLLRRGPRDGRGLDDLHARARRMRRDALRRGNLDGAVTRAQQLLDQAIAAERDELRGRDDDAARFAEAMLDNLPRSTSRAVQELADYDWASDEARALYQQILDGLRREVVEQRFAGMRDALRGRDPATDARLAEMLHDLNALLDRHARGEDTDDAFAQFMDKHGEFFPDQPRNVEELIDSLARRAAAGERLMRSLTPQQRAGAGRADGPGARRRPVARPSWPQLTDNLRTLRPELNWNRGERMRGEQDLGYGEATAALEEIAELDDLLDQLGQEHPGATLDDVDVEAVERQLGPVGRRRRAPAAGAGARAAPAGLGDPGRRRADADARRRCAGSAAPRWRTVFADLDGSRQGEHDLRDAGAAGELTGSSRRWQYGDEQPLDVVRTIGNAVRRRAGGGTAAPCPFAWSRRTSRSPRPNGGPRRRWRSAWTCRSR